MLQQVCFSSSSCGNRYPMEMHIVHRKQSYGSVHEALNHSDGLSVLAFFFEVSIVLILTNQSFSSHIIFWPIVCRGIYY
jgi:hypothetical protein